MNLIVAADQNWAIGRNNELLFRLPADMKHFRTTTTGNVVVMGRKTLESFPGGQPLKNRKNIVLSRWADYENPEVAVCRSAEELQEELQKPEYAGLDVFVIGGGSIYTLLLPLCNKAIVTRVLATAKDADTYFPNLDEDNNWEITAETQPQEDNGYTIRFVTYERIG